MSGITRSIRWGTQVAAASVVLTFLVSPVQAVTCDQVRSLTSTALSDWARRLKVKPENLAMLLEQSFCQVKKPSGVIISARWGTSSVARKS